MLSSAAIATAAALGMTTNGGQESDFDINELVRRLQILTRVDYVSFFLLLSHIVIGELETTRIPKICSCKSTSGTKPERLHPPGLPCELHQRDAREPWRREPGEFEKGLGALGPEQQRLLRHHDPNLGGQGARVEKQGGGGAGECKRAQIVHTDRDVRCRRLPLLNVDFLYHPSADVFNLDGKHFS